MAEWSLLKTRIAEGVWHGVLTGGPGGEARPSLSVTHLDREIDGAEVAPAPDAPGSWTVRVPIPPHCLSEGVQTFVIREAQSGAALDSFTVVAGEPLEEDIRGELDLLRAELDMLKKAFRRHCLETM